METNIKSELQGTVHPKINRQPERKLNDPIVVLGYEHTNLQAHALMQKIRKHSLRVYSSETESWKHLHFRIDRFGSLQQQGSVWGLLLSEWEAACEKLLMFITSIVLCIQIQKAIFDLPLMHFITAYHCGEMRRASFSIQ